MKRALWIVLLFSLPAFATISQRQAPVSTWQSSPSMTCSNTLGSAYHSGDLIVVWTFWTTMSSPNNVTATVSDLLNGSYPSAVGPTLQPAASNASAQIFYARNTASGSPPTITVCGRVGNGNAPVVPRFLIPRGAGAGAKAQRISIGHPEKSERRIAVRSAGFHAILPGRYGLDFLPPGQPLELR